MTTDLITSCRGKMPHDLCHIYILETDEDEEIVKTCEI